MKIRTCVSPNGRFEYGLHNQPQSQVKNLRQKDHHAQLGRLADGRPVFNRANFPQADLAAVDNDCVFEIANAFPFNGVTYINKRWADKRKRHPEAFTLASDDPVSFSKTMGDWLATQGFDPGKLGGSFDMLPQPLLIALAVTSSDPDDLIRLAHMSCELITDTKTRRPTGLKYGQDENGDAHAVINNRPLFEAVVNNRCLPDDYKAMMVLCPGVQGKSEIVGDFYQTQKTHVFEYIRRNSYIPYGHYAANMAHDAVRYRIEDLAKGDVAAMRHLYYQRTYVRMAQELGIDLAGGRKRLSAQQLDNGREKIIEKLHGPDKPRFLRFNGTLWGWNFGFDYSPSGYRLHASHQQVHQQFALIPSISARCCEGMDDKAQAHLAAFAYGDLIGEFVRDYHAVSGNAFFPAYLKAIDANCRIDGDQNGPRSLTVYENDYVVLFVPKAQTSQMELQLMTKGPVGNILEADTAVRTSLDYGIFVAVKVLAKLAAKMITTIEASKRFDDTESDQHLMVIFLPKTPESPRSFTQAQLRWICGHYPEDFAAACRNCLPKIKRRRK
jgi:hypothetical protein